MARELVTTLANLKAIDRGYGNHWGIGPDWEWMCDSLSVALQRCEEADKFANAIEAACLTETSDEEYPLEKKVWKALVDYTKATNQK